MNWLRRFMIGRYGGDQLSIALIILSVLLTLAGELASLPILIFMSYFPLLACVFRMLSRNIEKRRKENYKFTMLINPVYSWLKKKTKHVKDAKTHRYFKCPNCKTELRVPKGKGRIRITCPKCKTEFKERT